MATCFHQRPSNAEDDSAVLFSASNSPDESTASPSSTFYNSSSPPKHLHSYALTVKNLSCSVHPQNATFHGFFHKPKPTHILKSISFSARSSEILAVVGPSGTGKSTLLQTLSGRVKDRDFDPRSIYVNNRPMTRPELLRRVCGFVPQQDDLLPLLTVKETLMFSARFRLGNASEKEKMERVEGLMQELGLVHVADNFVGDEEKRGISGGERKRVSIGVDLIHDPPLLLLDEPTSGLDSTSALQVIELLCSMARTKQRIVILSIHQPGYRILHYISKFLILSRSVVAFHGTLNSLEESITKINFQIPIQLNPLEFAMEILENLENSNSNPNSKISNHDLDPDPDPEYMGLNQIIWREETVGLNSNQISNGHIFEIAFLCFRFWKIIYRTKQLLLARTMQALVGGFGLASVYVNTRKDKGAITERLGLFAFSLSFLLSSTVEALPIYLQERRVLMKEASRGAYRISSYMIANTIVFMPFLFIVALLFAVPIYWIVGLNPSLLAFAFFTFVVWLIVLMASSLVMFLSAVSPDFISGNSLICTVLGAFFLFSGYFIPKDNIPRYWMFMYYVSVYRYPLDSLLTNEYWSGKSECYSRRPEGEGGGCLLTGNDVLKSRGLEEDTRLMNVGIMFGFFVFYRLLCWAILARRASKTTI